MPILIQSLKGTLRSRSSAFQAFSRIFMVRHYEILTILPGTLSEADVTPVIQKVQEMIESEGATGLTLEAGGKSRLAYPIKHIRYGYFHVFTFELEASAINGVEEKLRLFGQLLRAIIRIFDPSKHEDVKQTMMSLMGTDEERSERDEPVREEKPVVKETPVEAPVVAEEAPKKAKKSEEKSPAVDLQNFDKELEAILDDKIAGL